MIVCTRKYGYIVQWHQMAPPPLAPTICQHAEHQGSKHLACTKWRKFNSSQKQIYEMPASSCRGTVASQPRGMTHASLENHSQQHGGRKCLIVWGRPALPVWSEAVFHVKCAPCPIMMICLAWAPLLHLCMELLPNFMLASFDLARKGSKGSTIIAPILSSRTAK